MAEPAPTAPLPLPQAPNEIRQNDGGAHDAEALYQSGDPPAYNTVLQSEPAATAMPHGTAAHQTTETARLLPTQDSRRVNGLLATQTTPRFSLTKFILLWLGIDRLYGFFCMILHFAFLGGGIAVICLTAVKGMSCSKIRTAEILTIIAGGVFILLAAALPCVWYCHHRKSVNSSQEARRHGYDYLPFNACYCLLSLAYVSIAVALATEIYDHQNLLWPWKNATDQECAGTTGRFDYLPLFTLLTMSGILVIFLVTSCVMFVAGCARKEAY